MSTAHVEFADGLRTGLKTLIGATVTYDGVSYPVYKKNIPKTPAATYVKIGEIMSNEDGTKDGFTYYGMVYIQVVDESGLRPGKTLAYGILGVLRGLLKPSITTVPTVTGMTVSMFSPAGYNEIEQQDENGTRIQLTDIYDFIIG
jgi:hypothetical protein